MCPWGFWVKFADIKVMGLIQAFSTIVDYYIMLALNVHVDQPH